MPFKKGVSGNPKGRAPIGLCFADTVRGVVGADGRKLVEMWAAVAYGVMPKLDDTISSNVVHLHCLQSLQREAKIADRILCSKLLAERGFGQPKQELEHSGTLNLPTTVIHEYHSS